MTDQQPTPPPLDLEEIEADVRGSGWQRALQQVPALVAEVRRLRAEVERRERARAATTLDHAEECGQLRADLAAARAALEHYADGSKWKARRGFGPTVDQDTQTWYVGVLHPDQQGYDVARAALAPPKEQQ